MKIETTFNIFDEVAILDLEGLPGVIIEICICPGMLLYKVEYWNEGHQQTAFIREHKLKKIK